MLIELIGLYCDEDRKRYDEVLACIKEAFYPKIGTAQVAALQKRFECELEKKCSTHAKHDKQFSEECARYFSGKIKYPYSNDFIGLLESVVNAYMMECGQACYTPYKAHLPSKRCTFPYANRYFEYFVKRKNSLQYTPKENLFNEVLELQPKSKGNESNNINDYHHFINVVLATARLMEYFSDPRHVKEQFSMAGGVEAFPFELLAFPNVNELSSTNNAQIKRPLKLLMAAYYHDLGKTVVYPRHAIEGSVILANHTTDSLYFLSEIVKNYGGNLDFMPEDLTYISRLVYYHDQFGTLGTGEAGYLRLVNMVYRMSASLSGDGADEFMESDAADPQYANLGEHANTINSARNLFDLWVLNLADIMVSINDRCAGERQAKMQLQSACFADRDATRTRIEVFLKRMSESRHDFIIAIKLLQTLGGKSHADDISKMEESALEFSRRHVVERIRRLVKTLLISNMSHYKEIFDLDKEDPLLQMLHEVANIGSTEWHTIITNSIKAVSDFREFTNRFSWVGQMDYSYSFFQAIATRAMYLIKNKVANPESTDEPFVGWCYVAHKQEDAARVKQKPEFLRRINAEFFVQNLVSVVIQILHHLLFREKEFDRLINFEFTDARDRLTNPKIDQIIAMQGPFREKRAVHLALEGIFFFK